MIAVYGGSFDPFGHHHQKACEHLIERFDEVFVVPAIAHAKKDAQAPYIHRVNMAKLALRDAPPGVLVSMMEAFLIQEEGPPVYTYRVIEAFRENFREPIWFAVGEDLEQEIQHWEQSSRILDSGIVVVPNVEGPHSSAIREQIKAGDPQWEEHVAPEVAAYIKRVGLYDA